MRRLLLSLIALLVLALPATASAREPWISEAKATAVAERHAQEEPESEFHWEVTEHSAYCYRKGSYWFKCNVYATMNAGTDAVEVKAQLLVIKTYAGRVVTYLWHSWVQMAIYPIEEER